MKYSVKVNENFTAVIDAHSIAIEPNGTLCLVRGSNLVAAFSAGQWLSVGETGSVGIPVPRYRDIGNGEYILLGEGQ